VPLAESQIVSGVRETAQFLRSSCGNSLAIWTTAREPARGGRTLRVCTGL